MDASTLNSPAELEQFGETLARDLPFGAVVILIGPMGAGKTTLTEGIARGLEDARSLRRMGSAELLEIARLTAIEWGEALIPELAGVTVLRFTILESGREVSLE